jgi:hypothetical protein
MKKILIIAITLLGLLGCKQGADAPTQSASPDTAASGASDGGQLTGALQADVQLEREVYFPGDQINIVVMATGYQDSAWVGIVPSAIPHGQEADNDANDLGYVFIKDNNRLMLVAPKEPGDYDMRLNDDDAEGQEMASRTFKVEADPAPVTAPALLWQPNGAEQVNNKLEVRFEAPLTFASDAWIGIVPSDTEHGKESVGDAANRGYEHLQGRGRGTVLLQVPAEAGKYDLRMYDTDADGSEVASISFEVEAE